jgi:hypothetical protein
MKQNMGLIDRIIRAVVAVLLLALSLNGGLNGVAGTIGIIIAVILILTAALGFCPLYLPFKFSTKKK